MNRKLIRELADEIHGVCGDKSWSVMEVCGTHTVSLMRMGIKSLLPGGLRLISGPGCPVCVTSSGYIETSCELSLNQDVIICTYGDMVRVPGRVGSLAEFRGEGADVRVVYCAREALKTAEQNRDKDIVFLAVGFETTAPSTAAAVLEAKNRGIDNFYILAAHKLVIPAMEALLSTGEVGIDGFMCPGHVSIVIGADAYKVITEQFAKPCVVTGFEAACMLRGILSIVNQLNEGEAYVDNVYGVAVKDEGNKVASEMTEKVFEVCDSVWRAMGVIGKSGLELRDEYKGFDARAKFGVEFGADYEPAGCRCGEVIQGKVEPDKCELFGKVCKPSSPVGPCMVSSEGTCSAWFKYGQCKVSEV